MDINEVMDSLETVIENQEIESKSKLTFREKWSNIYKNNEMAQWAKRYAGVCSILFGLTLESFWLGAALNPDIDPNVYHSLGGLGFAGLGFLCLFNANKYFKQIRRNRRAQKYHA